MRVTFSLEGGRDRGGVLQAGCGMLKALPDHDAPKDLTTIAEHAENILTRVLHAQSAVISVIDVQSKSMTTISVPPWLGARDLHPISLSNSAYAVVSQQPWCGVRFHTPL
jgi:hypothetical protein